MPYKFNAGGRHKIAQQSYRVKNSAAYNEALRNRGRLTIWLTEEALDHWHAPTRQTPGGQAAYSDLAIEIGLTLRLVYGLPLRQTQGFLRSIKELMNLDIRVPDYTTLSRRGKGLTIPKRAKPRGPRPIHLVVDSTGLKVFGEGEWQENKHKIGRKRRTWRKLHIGADLNDNDIIAAELTTETVGDTTALPALLRQFAGDIGQFLADGAYDAAPTYQLLAERPQSCAIQTVIPPPRNAVLSAPAAAGPRERDRHIQDIEYKGRMAWQKDSGYNLRSRIEAQVSRWKVVIGNKLKARSFANQVTEVKLAQKILNRMNELGRPMFERIA